MKIKLTASLLLILTFCAFITRDKMNVNIVFLGDSITHGTMAKDQSPPIYAGQYLNQQTKLFGKVQIANCGASGHTTVDFLPATHKDWPKVRAAADTFYTNKQAALVFSIMLGTNDSAIKGPNGAPVAPTDYRANLKTIADSLLAAYPNCKIVINYPIWYSNNTHNRGAAYMQQGQDRVRSYWPQIDTLVNSYKAVNPHHVFSGDKDAYPYFEKNYLTDLKPENGLDGVFYLHPNKKGDIALGGYWAKAIMKALK